MTGWKRWAVALLLLAAVAAAMVVALRSPKGLDSAAKVGALIAGLSPLVVGLILWARRSPRTPPAASTPEQVSAAQRQLAALVLAQWRTEIVVRQLDDPAPLAVRWRLTELNTSGQADYVARPTLLSYLIGQGIPRFEGRTDRISEMAKEFRKLPRRRLVILGDPGMGKTTLSVLLLRELLEHPDGNEPVPVLLTMSGWDPDAETLHTWVTRRLTEDYPALRAADFGPNAPRALVNQRRILPILDGLDELPERVRPKILDQLNSTAADPLILTCRTAEYETALADQGRRGLTGAAVIEPGQFKAADATVYLENYLPQRVGSGWTNLLSELRTGQNSPVVQALSSPLTLWLVRKVYIETRADPAELCDISRFATPDAITEHLLDHLIHALITANPPQRDTDSEHPFRPRYAWDPADAQKWLAFLAHHMKVIGTRDLAWWQLRLAAPRLIKSVAALVGRLLSSSPKTEPAYANLRIRGRIRPLFRALMTWDRTPLALALGLGGGLVFFVLAMFGEPKELEAWEHGFGGGAFMLVVALVIALASGLAEWTETPLTNKYSQNPAVTFHRDLQLAYVRSLSVGLAFGVVGLAFGLVFMLSALIAAGFAFGIVGLVLRLLFLFVFVLASGIVFGIVGLAFGLVFMLPFGLSRPSGQYLVAVAVLHARSRIPLRLLRFLNDAHRLGILREAGPVYQFRHAKLQDRLARTYTTDAS